MAQSSRIKGLEVDKASAGPRIDAFLHRGSCVLDFVKLGRDSRVSMVLGKHAPKLKIDDFGPFSNEHERLAALMKFMEQATDPKMVREAEVYRPVLVQCE